MPGEELVKNPTYVTSRAVSIHARPAAIWPWLVQMGELPRGGFYSYDWIERLLGMRVANSQQILSRYQHLEIGNALDRSGNLLVKAVVHSESLVLGPPEGSPWGASTWSIGLYPLDEDRRAWSCGCARASTGGRRRRSAGSSCWTRASS
jgi:hypothetical protein